MYGPPYYERGNRAMHSEVAPYSMIPVLHFMPYITNITVQHKGRTLPISTDLEIILTNYITLKLFSYQI